MASPIVVGIRGYVHKSCCCHRSLPSFDNVAGLAVSGTVHFWFLAGSKAVAKDTFACLGLFYARSYSSATIFNQMSPHKRSSTGQGEWNA